MHLQNPVPLSSLQRSKEPNKKEIKLKKSTMYTYIVYTQLSLELKPLRLSNGVK